MRFPPAFLEEIRDRLILSQVVGRRVRLRKAGREWSGLSPFNQEKTASFFVNDQKARWFDHSANKDGDVFAFLMETDGLTFPEAVERLAGEAGVPMPVRDPETIKREARRLSLLEVLENASRFFQTRLTSTSEGDGARRYLRARGIDDAAQARFGLGLAPQDGTALKAHLEEHGVGIDQATEAGLLRAEDDRSPVTRLRGRIVFPILDLKSRVIGFGGRALEPDAKPKYLNSPEGPTFDKGSVLYNADKARQPAWDGATVVALEGYVDVIASDAAGFPASVATMGTSITDGQLIGLWRLSDSPVICLDGDQAGRRAAAKVIKTALPMLQPGRSLRFAMMPAGLDPDDVVRKRGVASYASMINAAVPLADMLWRTSLADHAVATPDARAKLLAGIEELVTTIPDADLRRDYRRDMRDRVKAIPDRPPVVRANGGTFHSANPASQRLVHGIDLSGLSLNEAMTVAAMVAAPSTALDVIEAVVLDRKLSATAREAVSRIGDILAGLEDGADVVAALNAAGLAPTVAAAYDKVHRAGIHSLDPGRDQAAASKVLKRH